MEDTIKVGDMVILEHTSNTLPIYNPYIIRETNEEESYLESVTPDPTRRHKRLEYNSYFKKIVLGDTSQACLDAMFPDVK